MGMAGGSEGMGLISLEVGFVFRSQRSWGERKTVGLACDQSVSQSCGWWCFLQGWKTGDLISPRWEI